MKPLCQHCNRRKASSGKRGLCHRCYFEPGVRQRYTIQAVPTNRRGVLDRTGATPPPAKPTDAGPGTRSKVAVLMARAARGESLFHEGDCDTLDGVSASEMCFDAESAPPRQTGPRGKRKGSYKPRKKRKAA